MNDNSNKNERKAGPQSIEEPGQYRKPTVKKLDIYETSAIGGCDVEFLATNPAPPANCDQAS